MDAAHTELARELGWAIWEFCHDEARGDLHHDRARSFLKAYAEAGGPIPPEEYRYLTSFMRWRLRNEVRVALADPAWEHWNEAYTTGEVRAFQRLGADPFEP